jgi:hypothetical protein
LQLEQRLRQKSSFIDHMNKISTLSVCTRLEQNRSLDWFQVNALALALGAKTSVLGRADSITEFIRYGADSAETEIELNNAEGGGMRNYVINRC